MNLFLCYSLTERDSYVAGVLVRQAQGRGIVVAASSSSSMPGALSPGTIQAIRAADCVVAVVSHGSVGSHGVAAELAYAASQRKQIVALIERGVSIPALPSEVATVEFDRLHLDAAIEQVAAVVEAHGKQKNRDGLLVGGLLLLALYLLGRK